MQVSIVALLLCILVLISLWVFFYSFLLMPSLFENLNRIKPKLFQAALLFASPFLLLSIPWYLGVIKMEIGFPSWIVYFLFSNLFLVALVEEAFFRGYLQQRLQGLIGV